MKKLNLLISLLFVIQLTSFSQEFTNAISDNIEDFHEYNTEIIYLGDTLIVADSSVVYVYDDESSWPYIKVWYKERDTEGRQLINILYIWDSFKEALYLKNRDSISYFADGNIKERFTQTYDRIMENWKKSSYHLYNEDGLELIAESLQWDATIGQYFHGSQTIHDYNDYDSILNVEINLYDTATTYWNHSSKVEYLRDNNNFRIKREALKFNSTISEWYPVSNIEYLRDENSQIIREQNNTFSKVINDWYPISKIEYSFDDNNLLIEQLTASYDTVLNKWNYISLKEYLRDENGNDTLNISSTWNQEVNSWKQQSKNSRIFDNGHRVLFDEGTMWSDELEDWHFTFKTEYVYTEQGDQDTVTHYKWYLDYGFWYGTGRQIRDYDEDRVLINVENQDYDLVYEFWFNVSRVMWEYENDKLINFIIDDWKNGDWHGRTHTYYSYNAEGNRDTVISRHFSNAGSEWDFFTRSTTAFNNNGTVHYNHSERRSVNGDWSTDDKKFYYYSEFILPSAISEYNQIDFKVYPNPTRGEIFIELPEDSLGSAVVIISDMQGRVIEVALINNITKTIDLSRQQSGVYFVRISDGMKNGTKRIILN